MAAIREELYLADKFSGTFKNFDNAANASIYTAQQFQEALNGFTQGFLDGLEESLNASRNELSDMVSETERATAEQEQLANASNEVGDAIKDNESAQANFTKELGRSDGASNNLLSSVKKIATAIGAVKLAKDFIETADEMAQINAKLNLINDGFQTTADLQQMIYDSAQKTRSSYTDTATLVAKLGMNTGDTFKTNREMIAFAENLNKSFKVAGASAQEQSSVILQMSQALAGGVLRGQEFNAVMSGAPNIIKTVADYMGVSVGQMRDLAAEGQITAQTVKDALLNATDAINSQFESIPLTFSDTITTAKNKIINGMDEVFAEWTEKLGEADVQGAVDKVTDAILTLMKVGGKALVKIAEWVGDISENFEKIEPILETAAIAIIGYKVTCVSAAGEVTSAWATANAEIAKAGNLNLTGVSSLGAIGTALGIGVGYFFSTADDRAETAKNVMDSQLERKIAEANGTGLPMTPEAWINEQERVRKQTDWYAQTYGKVNTELTEAFKKNVEAMRVSQKDAWYKSYYGYDDYMAQKAEAQRVKEKDAWYKEYYGGAADTVEEIDNTIKSGVTVKGEVRLSDEDLKIFRDIAEGRYMTNVNLETLAPNVTVNVDGGTNVSEDDIADAVARVLVEKQAERTAIAHY